MIKISQIMSDSDKKDKISEKIDECTLKVNINDKLSKITEIYNIDKASGFILSNGKVLSNLDDYTFAKKLILDGTKFANVTQGPGSGGPCMKWCRFGRSVTSDYFYLDSYSWDAVIFVPKRNVMFHGFGIFSNWSKKDMKYRLKWYIGGEESEEKEFEIVDADADPEKRWYEINFSDMGEKPIKVSEGTEIDICIGCCTSDYEYRRCFYGNNGY